MTERGLIYGRASRDPKHRGTSVDDQIRECRAWADANGVEIVRTIRDDNRSASASAKRSREGFGTVLEIVNSRRIDTLIVWEASRASRDMEVFIELRRACLEAGVALSYKGRRFDLTLTNDSFSATLDALLAERDASEIRDRNMRTVRRNAEARRPHGRLPYGYRRVYDATSGSLLGQTPFVKADTAGAPLPRADGELIPVFPDSELPKTLSPEAQVLAEAAQAVIAGRSLRRITMDLNERGVPSPRRPNTKTLAENPAGVVSAWHPQSLRQRLINPTIAGRRVHQGQDIGEATWAPIIEYGTWMRLHAILADPSRRSISVPRGPEPRHLLSGIARCGECGARMKARTNMSRMPRAYTCDHEGCRRVTVTAPKVDEIVEAVLYRLFDSQGFRDDLATAYRQQSEREGTRAGPDPAAQIAALENERDELDQLRSEDLIKMRAYALEDKRIDEEIERIREQQVAPVTSPALRRMLDANTFAAGWEDADLFDRRDIVRILISVTVNRATVRGRAFDYGRVVFGPSDFLLDSWGRLSQEDPADLYLEQEDDEDFVPVAPSEDQVPPVPTEPQNVDEWADRVVETFPRPGPEVARQLAALLPRDREVSLDD